MAKARVEVRLERADRTWKAGETIRGEVYVRPEDDLNTREVTLTKQWRTHGRGNPQKGPETRLVLHQGPLSAGQEYHWPFELPTEPAPITYRGTLLNLDWYLTANLDVPWAFDPSSTVDVILVHGGEGAAYRTVSSGSGTIVLAKSGSFLAVGVLGGLTGLTAAGSGLAWLVGGALVAIAVPAAFAFLFFTFFLIAVRDWRTATRLGQPVVTVEPTTCRAGAAIAVRLVAHPPRPVDLDGASVLLRLVENVTSGSGTNRHSARNEMNVLKKEVPVPVGLSSSTLELDTTIDVPAGAPATLEVPDNHLRWFVRIELRLSGGTRWSDDFPVAID